MGVMGPLRDFLSCLCAGSPDLHSPITTPNIVSVCEKEPRQDGCLDVVAVGAAEDLLQLQKELSALSGISFKPRLSRLLTIVSAYANADASLFGIADEGQFVLLATSYATGPNVALETEPGHKKLSVLQSMHTCQRPVTEEHQTSETGSASTACCLCALCAVPLFGGAAGALLLEASPSTSRLSHPHDPLKDTAPQGHACSRRMRQQRQCLFSSPTLLHQLGLAVSMSLGIDSEQLRWLARALQRVACCDSMNSLVWELCEDFAAHVKRRFIVEVSVRAAMLPHPDAPLGLLFQAHPESHQSRSSKPLQADSAGLGAVSRSGRSIADSSSSVPGGGNAGAAAMVGTGAAQCSSKLGILSGQQQHGSRNRLNAMAASNMGSSDCGGAATSRGSTRPQQPSPHWCPFSTDHTSPFIRALNMYSDAAPGGGRSTDPHHHATATSAASLALSTAAASPLPSRTVIVQLPPHLAAEAPSASLHAQAFPLKHTVLQTLASSCSNSRGGGGGGGNGGRSGGAVGSSGFSGVCIEDVALYLQNVHNPSRDLCLLMSGLRCGGAQPGSPRLSHAPSGATSPSPGHTANGFAAAAGTASAGSACGGGGGAAAASTIPTSTTSLPSLVVVGLWLGEAVLALYLCFPKRLPVELLMAVRESCNELLGEVFVDPVHAKIHRCLAAEFEALRTTTPGHFAILRSASVNGLVHPRQGSLCSTSVRAARLATAPPRMSCGVTMHHHGAAETTTSGCTESQGGATTPTAGAATAAGEGVVPCPGISCLKLTWPVSMDCSSPGEASLYTSARGAADMQRTVSFCAERGGGGIAPGASTAGGGAGGGGKPSPLTATCRYVPRPGSRDLPHVALANDDLISVLLQVRQSETAYSQGEPRSASIMTVTGVDAAATTRQQLDLLVTSIHTTMTTEFNFTTAAHTEDLDSLELLEVLGKGGGGVVYKGRLGTQEVAVKVMELPDLDTGVSSLAYTGGAAATARPQQTQQQQGATASSTRSGPAGYHDASPPAPQVPNPAAAAAEAKEQLRARRALLRNAMEMAVQGRVSHPNLIQVYATYNNVLLERRYRPNGSIFHCLLSADSDVQDLGIMPPPPVCCAIVAELADCGSLAAALSARTFPRVVAVHRSPGDGGGSEQQQQQHYVQLDLRGVYMTLLDVALALRHLHSLHLVHRDLKPANLLLKSNPRDPRGFTVKLADFGFVLHLSEVAEDGTRYVMVDQACGTVTHLAPELLPGKARVEASADVYSFGILMWELLAGGVRPFPHLLPDNIPRHVYKGARPVFGDMVPLTYRALAQACWSADSNRRPKATDLVMMITSQLQELD